MFALGVAFFFVQQLITVFSLSTKDIDAWVQKQNTFWNVMGLKNRNSAISGNKGQTISETFQSQL